MTRVLVVYYSKTGNTEEMAKAVEQGVLSEDVDCILKRVEKIPVDELQKFHGVIIGSPTYFGTMAAEIKKFIDESIKHFGKLDGKVAGAFTSSGALGGGNETTVLDILQALLIHGMIIQGKSKGGHHYGPVSIGKPDETIKKECNELGRRVARLTKNLARSIT